MKKKKGFTLVELLVVIAILAVLATVSVVGYMGFTKKAHESNDASLTAQMNTALQANGVVKKNKTLTEAKKILNQAGLKYNYSVSGDENSLLVTDQTPSAGTTLTQNSIVCLYTEENETRVSVTVPDLVGMTLSQAEENLRSKNLNIAYDGSGTVIIKQETKKDSTVEEGTVIKVTLGTE